MHFSRLASAALLLGSAVAHPLSQSLSPRQENLDLVVLQFALTLEHLENVFYKTALTLFSEDDFKKAGFGKKFFQNLQFIVADEQSHVQLLTGAISAAGQAPVAPCTYNFPINDVNSFMTLSSILEGVGTSAYLGAAELLTDKTILTTAASILVTEALHTSQQRGELYQVPAANPLGTPVSANGIFTLAASFIVECPADNFALPFTAFPSLTVDATSCQDQKGGKWGKWWGRKTRRNDDYDDKKEEGKGDDKGDDKGDNKKDDNYDDKKDDKKDDYYKDIDEYDDKFNGWKKELVCPTPKAGEGAKFHASVEIPQGSFLTFVSGLTTISVQAFVSGTVIESTVPQGVSGQSYVFVTKTAITGTIVDADVIAGPGVLEVTPETPVIDDFTF